MENHDKEIMEVVNKLIKLVDGMSALDDVPSSDPAQKYALSKMYADKGFRDYMLRAIRTNNASIGRVTDLHGLWLCKGRIEVLTELLGISKQYFEDAAKLDKSLK